jgi:hypothetical protein
MQSVSFVLSCLACIAGALGGSDHSNDAELGMMTLKQAMRDTSLFWEVRQMMEDPDVLAEVGKMMADPVFQKQAKHAAMSAEMMAMEESPRKTLASILLALNPAPARQKGHVSQRSASAQMDALADLKDYAKKLNPAVGYWDPLKLSEQNFYDQGQEATIGFLRHAEIKHGRVAMAAFVGYLVQSNIPYLQGSQPLEQWDAMPAALKLLIIQSVGALEFYGEWAPGSDHPAGFNGVDGEPWVRPVNPGDENWKHYMKGGKPGKYPSLLGTGITPFKLDLWDPMRLTSKLSTEEKEKKLVAEVNNGRLAMIGIMAFVAEAKVPGSVPVLSSNGIVKPYAGEPMAPFAAGDDLPGVDAMAEFAKANLNFPFA